MEPKGLKVTLPKRVGCWWTFNGARDYGLSTAASWMHDGAFGSVQQVRSIGSIAVAT